MWTITGLYLYEMEVHKPTDADWACLGPSHKPKTADSDSLFEPQSQKNKEHTRTESVRFLITRRERKIQKESVVISITWQQESQMVSLFGSLSKDSKEHMCRLNLFGCKSQEKTRNF
jgi:hypothetical protein